MLGGIGPRSLVCLIALCVASQRRAAPLPLPGQPQKNIRGFTPECHVLVHSFRWLENQRTLQLTGKPLWKTELVQGAKQYHLDPSAVQLLEQGGSGEQQAWREALVRHWGALQQACTPVTAQVPVQPVRAVAAAWDGLSPTAGDSPTSDVHVLVTLPPAAR
jgi:hypothetical protein